MSVVEVISENTIKIPTVDDLSNIPEIDPDSIKVFFDGLLEKLISLSTRVMFTILFLIIGYIIIKLIRKIVKKAFAKMSIDIGVVHFVDACINLLLWFFIILTVLVNYGVDATSVVAVLGTAGLAVGLALQGALSNFVGGVLILILKPFKIGDYIIEDTKNNEGFVQEISIFYTKIHTKDNRTIVIPNGTLANSSLTNNTGLSTRRIDISVGISYSSDLKKAKQVLKDIALANESIDKASDITVAVTELGESSVIISLFAYAPSDIYFAVKCQLLEAIKLTFDQENINICYNQLDVHISDSDR